MLYNLTFIWDTDLATMFKIFFGMTILSWEASCRWFWTCGGVGGWEEKEINKGNRKWIFVLNFHVVWKYVASKNISIFKYWMKDIVKHNRIIFLKFMQKHIFKEKQFWSFERSVNAMQWVIGVFERNPAGSGETYVAAFSADNWLYHWILLAPFSEFQFLHL